MKILLPVDGSDCSARAVAALIARLGWYRERPELHVLYVHPPIPVGGVGDHVSRDAVTRHYRDEGAEELADARRQLDDAGIEYVAHIHVGDPAEVIAHQAEQIDCDLIHMGSHGRGMVSTAVLGSVVLKVLHLTRRPVLLAR